MRQLDGQRQRLAPGPELRPKALGRCRQGVLLALDVEAQEARAAVARAGVAAAGLVLDGDGEEAVERVLEQRVRAAALCA